jgi:hypothetical protein
VPNEGMQAQKSDVLGVWVHAFSIPSS